jgi:nucleoside-diphosphate-sugar epimerase
MGSYGQRKAECERVAMAQQLDGVPVVILRPSLVYGAYDHTDRMAYWLWRASRKEAFLLPDSGLTIVRRTYAPDLAKACAKSVASKDALGHAYNIAETELLNFRDLVYWAGVHLGTKPLEHAVPIPAARLLKAGIKPWVDLPMWIPETNLLVDTFRSRKELGFISTSAAQALADATDAFLREGREPKTGLSPSAEAEILSKLR